MNKLRKIPEISLGKRIAFASVLSLGLLAIGCEDKAPVDKSTPKSSEASPSPSTISFTFQPDGGNTGTTITCPADLTKNVSPEKGDSAASLLKRELTTAPTSNEDYLQHSGTATEDEDGRIKQSLYPKSSTIDSKTADGLADLMAGHVLDLNDGRNATFGEDYKIYITEACSKENFAAPSVK